jgi:Rap1a immunity proteins
MQFWRALTVGILLAPTLVYGQERITGKTLITQCSPAGERLDGRALTAEAAQASSFCQGFLAGVEYGHSALVQAGRAPLFCLPETVGMKEVIEVVLEYLRQHPDQRQRDGGTVVAEALGGRYPCP